MPWSLFKGERGTATSPIFSCCSSYCLEIFSLKVNWEANPMHAPKDCHLDRTKSGAQSFCWIYLITRIPSLWK
jgi:hypothetical protein